MIPDGVKRLEDLVGLADRLVGDGDLDVSVRRLVMLVDHREVTGLDK